jgi:hypothetical protein
MPSINGKMAKLGIYELFSKNAKIELAKTALNAPV